MKSRLNWLGAFLDLFDDSTRDYAQINVPKGYGHTYQSILRRQGIGSWGLLEAKHTENFKIDAHNKAKADKILANL